MAGTKVPECINCNNDLGSSVDAALGAIAISGKMEDQSITPEQLAKHWRCQSRIKDLNGVEVHPLKGSSVDGRVRLTLGYCEAPPLDRDIAGDTELSITFSLPDTRVVIGGLLHTGLLRLFHEFGYEYVLDSNVEDIRDRLTRASRARTPQQRIECFSGLSEVCRILAEPAQGSPDAFVLRELDGEPIAFGCCIPYSTTCGGIVLLPGMGQEGISGYQKVLQGLRGRFLFDPTGFHLHGRVDATPRPLCNDPKALFHAKLDRQQSVVEYTLQSPQQKRSISNLSREKSV